MNKINAYKVINDGVITFITKNKIINKKINKNK